MTGLAWGAGLGFVLGFVFFGFADLSGHASSQTPAFHLDFAILGGFAGALPFGLLGGLTGLLFSKYDDIELSKVKRENKKKSIESFFIDYNLKKE